MTDRFSAGYEDAVQRAARVSELEEILSLTSKACHEARGYWRLAMALLGAAFPLPPRADQRRQLLICTASSASAVRRLIRNDRHTPSRWSFPRRRESIGPVSARNRHAACERLFGQLRRRHGSPAFAGMSGWPRATHWISRAELEK